MAYRDETEALHARVSQLEAENEALRRRNDALLAAGPGTSNDMARRWLGGAIRLEQERTFAGELSREALEDLVTVARERLGAPGELVWMGDTLTWRMGPPRSQRVVELTASSRDGRTRVRLVERLGGLAGGLFGGIVGGAGGGGLAAVVPLGLLVSPALAVALGPIWVGLVYGIVRSVYGGVSLGRERELARLTSDLEEEVSRRLTHPAPNVRAAEPDADALSLPTEHPLRSDDDAELRELDAMNARVGSGSR